MTTILLAMKTEDCTVSDQPSLARNNVDRLPQTSNASRLVMFIAANTPAMVSSIGLLAGLLMLVCSAAHADIKDEIQVYADDINAAGQFHLELHINTTPKGRSAADYPGEITPLHALRINPEFSYGLSKTVELGLYIPTVLQSSGDYGIAGTKLRLKWLPIQPGDHGGWFAGENFEFSTLAKKYSKSRLALELRTITGWRNRDWLIAFNPIIDYDLSPATDRRNPDFNIGLKLSRRIFNGVQIGPEYYSDFGHVRHFEPYSRQDNTLYLVADIDRGPLPFQIGVGRGLTAASDYWTVKAILEIPFDQARQR